ncbi:MAG TPA: S8 family serine peptidase [Myxococcota bacterium]|nr:S8 family serine peptidase [Myxococcota bacterium]
MRREFLGRVACVAACVAWACATGGGFAAKLAPLWRPVAAGADANRLRIEPLNSAARLGESAHLRVLSRETAAATCVTADGEQLGGDAQGLVVPSPAAAAPVEIVCKSGGAQAHAQVTFTDSHSLPVADPYAGGVVLFKLRQLGKPFTDGAARKSLGSDTLDPKLAALGAVAVPAFPFDRTGTRDAVGLGLWIAIDLPEGVNFYQAVSWLRGDPDVFAESYLPEDGAYLRVAANGDWPRAFAAVTRVVNADDDAYQKQIQQAAQKRAMPTQASPDLSAIGAPQVWTEEQGDGIRLAVIDTGVDIDHASLRPNLLRKPNERAGDDFDGNGVPGDEFGVNLAALALAHGAGGEKLGLGLASNVSDWAGADDRTRHDWGHGTAVASIAAGSAAGTRIGVAPRAQILPVDIQENLRTSLTQRSGDDPRMANGDSTVRPLRPMSVWSRAAGVAYAVGERSRVLTCAWPGQEANWLLHDALLFAEDNCAVAVCGPGDEPGAQGSFPSHWRESWLRKHAGENDTGVVYDPWTGQEVASVLLRPLRALVVAEVAPTPGTDADLVLPQPGGQKLVLEGAVSNPWNDGTSIPDKRTAPVTGSAGAVGLAAGAAVLVTGLRPDLEPYAVQRALVAGAVRSATGPALSVPNAVAATGQMEQGDCRNLERRDPRREATPSPWPKLKLSVDPDSQNRPGSAPPPASPDRNPRY